jgi:serpin B
VDIELAASTVAHLDGSAGDASSAAAAAHDFGLALYASVAGADPNANLLLSPASIALALSMARAGARGETAAEMDAVLRDLGTDEHAAWIAALDAALSARSGQFPDLSGEPREVTLRIVNAPFAQRGFALQPAYLDALAGRFGAGLRLVDYAGATEGARRLINAWVADETEQRIEELLAQGILTTDTRLVLVNAIYLKAAWQTAFVEGATQPAPFTRGDGLAVDVPFMHTSAALPFAAGAGWRAVELPYVGGKLSMLVIVPDDLAAFASGLDGAGLAAITESLSSTRVELALPKFGFESRFELNEPLAGLGMPTAFTELADFSGISTQERLLISAVIHQANIDVDEKGTEAAAATAVVMERTSAPAPGIALTVDHPFLIALRDRATGAVLFLGRVANPSAGKAS